MYHSEIIASGAIRAATMLARAGLLSFAGSHFSSQPQTVERKCAMLTRLARISIIHGCSSIRHGEARRDGSFSRLEFVSGCFSLRDRRWTYQHSMKYLKLSLHLMPASGSSFSFGIGCRTIYVNRSINPARGCISVPSAGNGKRCCATSSKVTPVDQTSEVMV